MRECAAKNLPSSVNVSELTRLFDAPGLVANIRILKNLYNRPDGQECKAAVIAYYSEETAMKALQELDGNMALDLSNPLELEYFGPADNISTVEKELEKKLQARDGFNSNHHFMDEREIAASLAMLAAQIGVAEEIQ